MSKKKDKPAGIRDRIKELRRVKASEIVRNPKNFRRHPEEQRTALRGVLTEIGYADALLVRELEDGRLMLIDGEARADLTPDQIVPVLLLDVTEAEADKLLATFDPITGMAEVDEAALDALLAGIDSTSDEIAALLAELGGVTVIDESTIRPIEIKPPPKFTWALVGIPTVKFGLIAETIERIALIEDAVVHTSANDG